MFLFLFFRIYWVIKNALVYFHWLLKLLMIPLCWSRWTGFSYRCMLFFLERVLASPPYFLETSSDCWGGMYQYLQNGTAKYEMKFVISVFLWGKWYIPFSDRFLILSSFLCNTCNVHRHNAERQALTDLHMHFLKFISRWERQCLCSQSLNWNKVECFKA